MNPREAEQRLVGVLLLGREHHWHLARRLVGPSDFSDPVHRSLFIAVGAEHLGLHQKPPLGHEGGRFCPRRLIKSLEALDIFENGRWDLRSWAALPDYAAMLALLAEQNPQGERVCLLAFKVRAAARDRNTRQTKKGQRDHENTTTASSEGARARALVTATAAP